MARDSKTEISFEVDREECAVLDGYCNARGVSRTAVMRRILKEWSTLELSAAVSIIRTTGVNPMRPGTDRD